MTISSCVHDLLQMPLYEVLQGCLQYQGHCYDTAACCHAWRVQTLLPAYITIYDKSLMDCNNRDYTCTFFGAPLHHCQVVTTSVVAGAQIADMQCSDAFMAMRHAQQMLTCVLQAVQQCTQLSHYLTTLTGLRGVLPLSPQADFGPTAPRAANLYLDPTAEPLLPSAEGAPPNCCSSCCGDEDD